MTLNVYLSGEIHTDWREQIVQGAADLDVSFSAPVTDHDASDDCGVAILGAEADKFWHDRKGAQMNAIRTRKGIEDADIVVAFWRSIQTVERSLRRGLCCGLGQVTDHAARRAT